MEMAVYVNISVKLSDSALLIKSRHMTIEVNDSKVAIRPRTRKAVGTM